MLGMFILLLACAPDIVQFDPDPLVGYINAPADLYVTNLTDEGIYVSALETGDDTFWTVDLGAALQPGERVATQVNFYAMAVDDTRRFVIPVDIWFCGEADTCIPGETPDAVASAAVEVDK